MISKPTNYIILGCILLNLILFILFLLFHYYSPIAVMLHIVSLLVLWAISLREIDLIKLLRRKWKEFLIIVSIVITSLFVGFYRIEEVTPGMYMDEVTVALSGLKILDRQDLPPFVGDYSHPTPLLYMTGLSVQMFGHTMTAIRLPSIIFAALTVAAFYILLRLFFPISVAVMGAILMVFQYTHVVLSRLAYEPPASLFCQIVTLIFLSLYYKSKNQVYLLGIALSMGAGLYTYLNFRPFAVIIFLLTIYLILKENWRQQIYQAMLFTAVVFIAAMPLISYAFIDTYGFWSRAAEISIFGRGYSPTEFIKELWGNIYRTAAIPFIGDPNPGKNPSRVPLFDPLTLIMAAVGLVYLFREKRTLFGIVILLFLPPFISDIFATEVIPEGHYYGMGHPNALRVSGLIILILFTATAGIMWAYSQWGKKHFGEYITVCSISLLIISSMNGYLYFNQADVNPSYYAYNYKYNNAYVIDTAKYLNKSSELNIHMTKALADNGLMLFFLNPAKKVMPFELVATSSGIKAIKQSSIAVIGVNEKTVPMIRSLENDILQAGYVPQVLRGPSGEPYVVILEK